MSQRLRDRPPRRFIIAENMDLVPSLS